MTGKQWLATAALLAASLTPLHAQKHTIDSHNSVLTVHVYKAGMLSAFGHDHDIAAPITSGSVDTGAKHVEFRVNSAALKVKDPNASEKDREEIQKTMLGPDVLDTAQHAEISFRSTGAEQAGEGAWTVHGDLNLHGQTHPITVEVKEQGGHYTGSARLRQSEFGMKPVKVAGGTVRVKDEVRVDFDIQLAH